MACAASTDPLERGWRVAPQVALRPEPFGALLYHFGTRRLTFLKTRRLLDVVRVLNEHTTAGEACDAAGVPASERPGYARALTTLAGAGMIVPQDAS